MSDDANALPAPRRLSVNGAELDCVEQGAGVAVVFVHGAFMDHRYWAPQRDPVAAQYRFVAYDWRYHGGAPWQDQGEHYTLTVHTADLVAFIRLLNAGPVHLVTLSSGGILAATAALEHPELIRSLTLVEPALTALLAGLPEASAALEQRSTAFLPIVDAVKAGDAPRAARLFFELVNNEGPGAFDRQPATFREMVLENARTVPLLLRAMASGPPPKLTRASLAGITAPTLVVQGERTLPFFAVTDDLVLRAIPGSQRVVVPNATHMMSFRNPPDFNAAILRFLANG